jgi:PAS domain S-box-containing protein
MKLLHLEDNPADAELVSEVFASDFPGTSIIVVDSRDRFIDALVERNPPDIIISDFTLPSFDGLSALELARARSPDVPFVFLSGSIGEERAIAAVRAGAYDYVLKENMARLPVVIRRALDDFAQRHMRRESDKRLMELAGIIERASEAIVVSDMSGRITLWNDGAARLYGVKAVDAVGRRAEEVLSRNEIRHLRDARSSTLEKGDWQREIQITTRDGRDIFVDFRMSLVRDANGNPSARLSIATDITERKRLEEQFLRTQRLESLGLLAAGIAHDLNNVLAPVLMTAPLLRGHVTGSADLRILDILEKSAERGASLVRQILGFARGAGGGFQLIQVRHLLHDLSDVIRAGFPKSIVLDEDIAGDLWPIQADATQIHQILLNLAVNARDAMLPRGGTLRLKAENRILNEEDAAAIEGARPGPFLVLTIADTGTGMTAEVLARIWEPFFTTKGEGKGTGLGLPTVRGIAAAHNGFITIDSQVGRGTSFSVFLPPDKSAVGNSITVESPESPQGNGELVLVVDDEANVGAVTTAILTRFGFRVISCSDGVEAIGLFTEHKEEILLVVTDLNMPNVDGAALALVLRRLRPDISILAITGLGSYGSQDQLESAGFAAKLQKPFGATALLSAVQQAMKGKALLPQVTNRE